MSVATDNDLGIFLSGGSDNGNPYVSYGGLRSSKRVTQDILNNFFRNVTTAEALAGEEFYLCAYWMNTGSFTIYAPRVFATQHDNRFSFGLAPAGKNTTAPSTGSILTPPSGVSFSAPLTYETGLIVDPSNNVLNAGDYMAVWVKFNVPPNSPSVAEIIEYVCMRGRNVA